MTIDYTSPGTKALGDGTKPNSLGKISAKDSRREGITSLAVNRGRLFTGLYEFGVYMFDERSEKWFPAGLQEFHVTALGSHQSYLYAATGEPGAIYRASIPIVQLYGKAATTWGAVKRQ